VIDHMYSQCYVCFHGHMQLRVVKGHMVSHGHMQSHSHMQGANIVHHTI
jgi:hypothetical protein